MTDPLEIVSSYRLEEIYTVHRGLSSTCWVLVRDLAIDMRFFGVIGFLCIKTTS